MSTGFSLQCPLPKSRYEQIIVGHGGGGSLTASLIEEIFLPAFNNPLLSRLEDQATLDFPTGKLAFTTDSFVVQPLFFPGGDIGSLSIYGTVNDLAVGGARPLFVSAAFVIEEGFPIEDLKRVVQSTASACEKAGVSLVAGDTKVVERGKGDKLFITTSGIGVIPEGISLSVSKARPSDTVIVSGTIGDHSIAVLSAREGLSFETDLKSDSAPLTELTRLMIEVCPDIRCMRDATRGGVSSALYEIAIASRVGIHIHESALPIREEVRAATEILGLPPLDIANEGKLVAVVPKEDAERVCKAMRTHPLGKQAAIIGSIVEEHPGLLTIEALSGTQRIVPRLSGDLLPRIC